MGCVVDWTRVQAARAPDEAEPTSGLESGSTLTCRLSYNVCAYENIVDILYTFDLLYTFDFTFLGPCRTLQADPIDTTGQNPSVDSICSQAISIDLAKSAMRRSSTTSNLSGLFLRSVNLTRCSKYRP